MNLHILLMSHFTPTINCSRIRMVKYLLDMLALTAGMDRLWRRSGFRKGVWRVFLWMSSWHHLGTRKIPDQRLHMAQRLHTDIGLTWVTLTPMFCMVSLQNICVSATQVSPLSVWSLWTIWSLWSEVCLLQVSCHEDIHRKILNVLLRYPDLLHRWSIPAVSTNVPGKRFTILILEQFIVGVK